MESFFHPVVNDIIKTTCDHISDAKKRGRLPVARNGRGGGTVHIVVLAGGFGASPYLEAKASRVLPIIVTIETYIRLGLIGHGDVTADLNGLLQMREAASDLQGVQVQSVRKAQLAVVLGAAAWGRQCGNIVARRLEHGFGAEITRKLVHDPKQPKRSNDLRSILQHFPEASLPPSRPGQPLPQAIRVRRPGVFFWLRCTGNIDCSLSPLALLDVPRTSTVNYWGLCTVQAKREVKLYTEHGQLSEIVTKVDNYFDLIKNAEEICSVPSKLICQLEVQVVPVPAVPKGPGFVPIIKVLITIGLFLPQPNDKTSREFYKDPDGNDKVTIVLFDRKEPKTESGQPAREGVRVGRGRPSLELEATAAGSGLVPSWRGHRRPIPFGDCSCQGICTLCPVHFRKRGICEVRQVALRSSLPRSSLHAVFFTFMLTFSKVLLFSG